MLILALLLAAVHQEAAPGSPADGYLARFERALDSFDRGKFEAAADGFESAGERAPGAPVWRVSAGLSRARAGDEDAARALFEDALGRGYPPSDLAALHPLGAEVAVDLEDGERQGWVAVTARGLRDVHGDHRTARLRPIEGVEPAATHFLGLYNLGSSSARGIHGSWHMEHFRFDRPTGRVDRVAVVEKGSFGMSPESYCMPDRVDPWPRIIPFVRALRTGLLVDVPADPISAKRQWMLGYAWARSFDPERLRWSGVGLPVQPRSFPPAGLEMLDDDELDEKVARLLRPRAANEEIAVGRIEAPDGSPSGRLLAAVCRRYTGHRLGSPRAPLLVLDEEDLQVLGRIESPEQMAALYPVATLVSVDPKRNRLVIGFGESPVRLRAFDLDTFEEVWMLDVQGGHALGVQDGLILVSGGRPPVALVRGGETGDLVLDGATFGLFRLGLSEDGRWIWGEGRDSLALFEAHAVARRADDGGGEQLSPLIHLWDVSGHAVAVACDGTWSVPRSLLEGDGRVLIGDRLEPALDYAPWLLDPLHVRTIDADRDRRPRRFPRVE